MKKSVTVSLLIVLLFSACSSQNQPKKNKPLMNKNLNAIEINTTNSEDKILPVEKKMECSALESQLYQLTQMEEGLTMAEKLGFRVSNQKIQVLIILNETETSFLAQYQVEIGTQSGNQVQAFVPLDQLCPLAALDAVQAIRVSQQATMP